MICWKFFRDIVVTNFAGLFERDSLEELGIRHIDMTGPEATDKAESQAEMSKGIVKGDKKLSQARQGFVVAAEVHDKAKQSRLDLDHHYGEYESKESPYWARQSLGTIVVDFSEVDSDLESDHGKYEQLKSKESLTAVDFNEAGVIHSNLECDYGEYEQLKSRESLDQVAMGNFIGTGGTSSPEDIEHDYSECDQVKSKESLDQAVTRARFDRAGESCDQIEPVDYEQLETEESVINAGCSLDLSESFVNSGQSLSIDGHDYDLVEEGCDDTGSSGDMELALDQLEMGCQQAKQVHDQSGDLSLMTCDSDQFGQSHLEGEHDYEAVGESNDQLEQSPDVVGRCQSQVQDQTETKQTRAVLSQDKPGQHYTKGTVRNVC